MKMEFDLITKIMRSDCPPHKRLVIAIQFLWTSVEFSYYYLLMIIGGSRPRTGQSEVVAGEINERKVYK